MRGSLADASLSEPLDDEVPNLCESTIMSKEQIIAAWKQHLYSSVSSAIALNDDALHRAFLACSWATISKELLLGTWSYCIRAYR